MTYIEYQKILKFLENNKVKLSPADQKFAEACLIRVTYDDVVTNFDLLVNNEFNVLRKSKVSLLRILTANPEVLEAAIGALPKDDRSLRSLRTFYDKGKVIINNKPSIYDETSEVSFGGR